MLCEYNTSIRRNTKHMRIPALLALAATLSLAACGGGSGSSAPPTGGGGGTGQTAQAQAETAIDTTNSVGDPVKTLTNFNQSVSGVLLATRSGSYRNDLTSGVCSNGVEFFSPDKNGDPNSTEEQYFYDSACTEIARDVVRLYTINGTSETVMRTENQYAINNATAIATRTTTNNFVNGTYGTNGFPDPADGFARTSTSTLTIGTAKTLNSDDELVLLAGSGGVNSYCADGAGYNVTGIESLNETFGWESITNGGTRTVNGDGSITWQSTHNGTAMKGAIGSLNINVGTANTVCPISTPDYTVGGGTAQGSYTIPVTATFLHGELTNLTVSGATLPSGNTLNVTTNTSVSPTTSQFITGTVSSGTTQIATFAVDTFGDGTLTVTSSGTQFVITDWHVVR
jgi:uncharacterized protein YdeI (BOF family)